MTDKRQLRREQKPAQQTDRGKRELIQNTLVSATIAVLADASPPARWIRPLVDSVILPAHAQTSLCEGVFIGSVDGFCVGGETVEFIVAAPAIAVNLHVPSFASMLVQIPEESFSGSGIIAADGSIDVIITTGETGEDLRVLGSLAINCEQITGIVEDADKTNSVSYCSDTGTFTAVKQ